MFARLAVLSIGIFSLQFQDLASAASNADTIELTGGQTVAIERGVLKVPANHARSGDDVITIAYARIRATKRETAPAIFFLEGGPGASGLERLERKQLALLYTRLSAHADLIFFDQRGTGASMPSTKCGSRTRERH